MKIIEITKYNDDFLEAANLLLSQLSSSSKPLSKIDLTQIIESDATKFFLVVEKSCVIGSLTLVLFKTPSVNRARIEDLIVDHVARRKGAGKLLVERAIKCAKESGAETVDLTSHPSRKSANTL